LRQTRLAPVDLDGEATVDVLPGVLRHARRWDRISDYNVTLVPSPDVAPGVILTDVGTAQRLLDMEGFSAA
jgi:putative ABC transport system permease protein